MMFWLLGQSPPRTKMALGWGPRAGFRNGRGDRIRTCDPLFPKQMRYQAAPLPDRGFGNEDGGPGRIRTRDLAVMSGQL